MKKTLVLLLAGLLLFLISAAAPAAPSPQGHIVVANRASGTISVIDVATDQVEQTIALPGPSPEPMYVVYTNSHGGRVFVGDRANNRVVVYNAHTFALVGTVPAGNGVFHMWADRRGTQLWVNNDIDNTITVINPKTLAVIATVSLPADLVAQGGKPHDVILDDGGHSAFVSLVGLAGANDYVAKYDTATFDLVALTAVAKDPHLSLTRRNNLLYVPTQGGNGVALLDRTTLEIVGEIPVPGAHGAGMRRDGRVFYTTNLPGGGANGLFAIDTRTNTVIGSADTPYPVPHNIALNRQGSKLYITHSGGTADKVTVYTASKHHPVPVLAGEITVGLNPFGLAFVPR